MPDPIVQITRGLKLVKTTGEARAVITDAIEGVNRALRSGPSLRGDLLQSRADLRKWLASLAGKSVLSPCPDFQKKSQLIVRAWVNVAGAGGEVRARRSVSLFRELEKAGSELPTKVFAPVGRALGDVARNVGEAGGAAVGGILSGLGPIVIVIVAIVIWVKFFRKATS